MKEVRVEILTIGDEILYGQITDTNSQWIGEKMTTAGFRVIRKTSVGDQENVILNAFAEAEERADVVLITGGLGPTADDLTKPMLSRYFNSPLLLHSEALAQLKALFEQRGFQLTDTNRKQAELPEVCTYIPNPLGTAPGMWFEKNGKVFMSMPGVPHEMKHMLEFNVIPRLVKVFEPPVIYHRMIRTAGIGESWLADKIKDWEESLPPHLKLAYLPSLGEVRLRVTGFGQHLAALQNEVEDQCQMLMPLIKEWVYGYEDDTLARAVGNILQKEEKTMAIAESCTSGYVSYTLTSVPGSSFYFKGSMVAYHNEVKENLLGVQQDTLQNYGAVSEQTAREMAERVREKFKTDYGLSTTGIAGPGGGTAEKPVGLVWIAITNGKQTITKKLNLTKERDTNIRYTASAILNLFRQTLATKGWESAGK